MNMSNKSIRQITIHYDFGKVVYQRCDELQVPLMVTGMMLEPGSVKYRCHGIDGDIWLYDFELTTDADTASLN